MIDTDEIPEFLICHVCGRPMKLVDVSALARSLGSILRSGSYSIECCDFELTIDDPDLASEALRTLLEYHSQTSE